MSKSELHDWECEIEELSGNNADKMLEIAQDIYNTAFVRGKNHMTWEQEPCEDCISRKATLDMATTIQTDDCSRNETIEVVDVDDVRVLPPVTPTRKKGHWIMTGDYLTAAYETIDYVKCSCCGEESLEEGDYCPNCGSYMKGEFE